MCALETSTSGHAHHKPTASAMWGRGVVREARATLGTWWLKEMINFNVKTVAVSFFLYLACVAPAITFGARSTRSSSAAGWVRLRRWSRRRGPASCTP